MKRSISGLAPVSNVSSSLVGLGKAHYVYAPPQWGMSDPIRADGLECLRGKLVRYWTDENRDGVCEHAYLVGWDQYGMLVQPEEDGKPWPDAYNFVPWSRLDSISYFASDSEDGD